jgi:DNA polymerase eta
VASWVGNLIPIHPAPEPSESEPGAEQDGVAHDPGKEEEAQTTWADYAFSIGAEMTQEIRDEVRNTLGYTTSAGIARNKVLAKVSFPAPIQSGNKLLILWL